MIISGANLSEEYFTNRTDRYLLIKDYKTIKNEEPITNDNKLDNISNNNGLVQCYADIIEALCQHSDEYTEMDILLLLIIIIKLKK